MSDLIREAPLGQFLRWATGNRILKYPEEMEGFELPESYITAMNSGSAESKFDHIESRKASTPGAQSTSDDEAALEKAETAADPNPYEADPELARTLSRQETTAFTEARLEVDLRDALERTQSKPIIPAKTREGNILVDWYTTDDTANPQNWTAGKKGWIAFLICLYTFVVYTGSAIYTSSESQLIDVFGINPTDASLPLSLYVLAYGMGPLIFAPLSEIPVIGRSPVYLVTFLIFTIVSLPAALVNNFAGLLVLRFLQGFFGSPCLANGAATLGDMYSMLALPFAMIAWVSAAYCGPALGPLISGFAVTAEGWRWSLWEIFWAACPTLILMFSLLPETHTPNILLRRAARLRKLTGDNRLMAQSEIDQKNLKPVAIFVDALIKPLEITIKDPAIAFVNLYTALVYGIYYSFFEVFPLVYPVYYGFSIGLIGVVFTCILVACLIGVAIYVAYLKFYMIPDILKNGMGAQERRLVPALFAAFGPPIGLFIFAWTAREDITWVAPTIGIVVYGATVFVVMQCIFTYVPMSYPQYAASLFASNDFFRSALACGSILFARPLFINLGVDRGVSLLGGLSTLGIIGMFGLWIFGAKLRARSKFASS
jgi:MFS transporter, DHA1 family, multidrug resistance protein